MRSHQSMSYWCLNFGLYGKILEWFRKWIFQRNLNTIFLWHTDASSGYRDVPLCHCVKVSPIMEALKCQCTAVNYWRGWKLIPFLSSRQGSSSHLMDEIKTQWHFVFAYMFMCCCEGCFCCEKMSSWLLQDLTKASFRTWFERCLKASRPWKCKANGYTNVVLSLTACSVVHSAQIDSPTVNEIRSVFVGVCMQKTVCPNYKAVKFLLSCCAFHNLKGIFFSPKTAAEVAFGQWTHCFTANGDVTSCLPGVCFPCPAES